MDFEPTIDPYGQPHMFISIEGQPVDLNWENTSLYTHAEQYKNIDHIFIDIGEEELHKNPHIFREMAPEYFDDLFNALIGADYQRLHKPEPYEGDVEQYYATLAFIGTTVTKEVVVIEEVEDEQVILEAMLDFDAKIKWFTGEWS